MNNKVIRYISIIILLGFTSLFSINLYFQNRVARDRVDIRTFPYIIGNWKGKDLRVTEYEYSVLETRNLILREYVNSSNDRLTLFIIYSETNRSVFHPPEVCLIGSAIKILDKETEEIDFGKTNFFTNKLYTEKDNRRYLILYCYKAGNFYTDNFYLQQLYFALNQLFVRHVKGAIIRVSMPIGENETNTLATLKAFIEKSAKIIDYLPSDAPS
jgi:EpsI family protein